MKTALMPVKDADLLHSLEHAHVREGKSQNISSKNILESIPRMFGDCECYL